MPDQSAESTQVVETPQVPPEQSQTPQQETREALYNKLYRQTQQQETVQQVAQPLATQEPDYKSMFSHLSSQLPQLIEKQRPAAAPAIAQPSLPHGDCFSLLPQYKRTQPGHARKAHFA